MKISTRARYGLRIMVDLAQHRDEGYISLKTIAVRQGISKRYLDQIMLLINRTNFLSTTRGAQGGYKLAKEPKEYSLGDIIRVTEGGFAPIQCLEDEEHECGREGNCIARKVWQGLNDVMADYVNNLTLQDILDKYDTDSRPDLAI